MHGVCMIYIANVNETVENEWVVFQDYYHPHYDFVEFGKAIRYYGRPFRYLRLPLSFYNHNRDYHLFLAMGKEFIQPLHFRAMLSGCLLEALRPTTDYSKYSPLEASGKQLPGPSSKDYLGDFFPRHRALQCAVLPSQG